MLLNLQDGRRYRVEAQRKSEGGTTFAILYYQSKGTFSEKKDYESLKEF